MRYHYLILLIFILGLSGHAQNRKADSLAKAYTRATTDIARADILFDLGNIYAQNRPDSELFKARQALFISRKARYLTGERRSLKQMAEAYQFMGNYPLALQFYLERLKLDEQQHGSEEAVVTLLSIANLYQSAGYFRQALVYARKGALLIERNRLDGYRWYSDMVFGDAYEKMNDTKNAILYNDKAYKLALMAKDSAWLGMSLNNMGNAYRKANRPEQALLCYRRAIPFLVLAQNASFLCESYEGLATIKFQKGQADSAIIYGKRSLILATDRNFSEKYIRACSLLTEIYKTGRQPDSALAYQGKLLVMKDSVYSQEKERQLANLTIAEQVRQKDILQEKADQERRRLQEETDQEKHRSYILNMLLVGLLIPFSFLVSLVLSKKKMHPKVVEISGVISLLLLFEYLTILLHPAVERWTDDSPFLEIIIFVALAAVLTPAHHRLEHWMLTRLTAHHHHAKKEEVTSSPVSSSDQV